MKNTPATKKLNAPPVKLRGFSLLEALIAVGVISCVAAVAYVMIPDLASVSRSTKLSADVTTLNNAVRTYLVNGGQIPAAATGPQILDRLKSSASSNSRARLAGIRGSMLDPRLRGELITDPGEARAVWDATKQRFEILNSGTGFRAFDLGGDPTAVIAEEERTRTLDLATRGNWVWDFAEDGSRTRRSPNAIATTDTPVSQPGALSSIVQLVTPDFSLPGALYDLSAYNPVLQVSLRDRNEPGTSRLYYSVNNGPWIEYEGTPLNIPPHLTSTVRTYAAAVDPENYLDSELMAEKYETIFFTGSSKGDFHTPGGDARIKTNLASGQKGPSFLWGDPATADKLQNRLNFKGASFESVAPDEEFALGTLEYYNGTTYTGTNATNVQIAIDLDLTTPGVRETLNFTFRLLSTPNGGVDADADADYVYIPDVSTNFRTSIKGRQFQLILRFGEHGPNGFTTIDTFHAHEGKTLSGTIYGRLSEVK